MKDESVRPVTEGDYVTIMEALAPRVFAAGAVKGWAAEFDSAHAGEFLDRLMTEVEAVIIDETFLLCYNIVNPWFTSKRYFAEGLVLRINKNSIPFGRVVEVMEQISKEQACSGITVSTDLSENDGAIVNKYEQHGFQVEGVRLFKQI